MGDFLPTASLQTLRERANLLRLTRAYFDAQGYFEVDTPLISADITVDAWIDPFVVFWNSDPEAGAAERGTWRYLQTSPEYAMKRLLAAGATQIYQLGKVFRQGEVGSRHNPEFTMLEWYRTGVDLEAQMTLTEAYVRHVADIWPAGGELLQRTPYERLSYTEAFERILEIDPLAASLDELRSCATKGHLIPPPGLSDSDRDGWLNWLLAETIEPTLGQERPVFLTDYPASQSALAVTAFDCRGRRIARRFELYVRGIELCNGYQELTDPQELRRRNRQQSILRAEAGRLELPHESRLLAAMDSGLPESAGVALGFDRLAMQLFGARTIEEVIPFPFSRA